MKIVVIGDIHGRWNKVNKIVNHELPTGGFALSTGDLGNYDFQPLNEQTLVFCYGNHENFGFVKRLLGNKENNLVTLLSGQTYKLSDGTTLTTLPGVFSQRFFATNGPIKYFSREDVEKILSIKHPVDILMTHEAPFGIGVKKGEKDLGKKQINRIMDHLKPRIAFFGHHHQSFDKYYNGTRVIGMDMPHHFYIRLNTKDFSIEKVTSRLEGRLGYKYEWEEK